MNDALARLTATLEDPYAIERKLGSRGMGDAGSAYPTLDFPQLAGRVPPDGRQTAARWRWHGGNLGE